MRYANHSRRCFIGASSAACVAAFAGQPLVDAADRDEWGGFPIGVQTISLRKYALPEVLRHSAGHGCALCRVLGQQPSAGDSDRRTNRDSPPARRQRQPEDHGPGGESLWQRSCCATAPLNSPRSSAFARSPPIHSPMPKHSRASTRSSPSTTSASPSTIMVPARCTTSSIASPARSRPRPAHRRLRRLRTLSIQRRRPDPLPADAGRPRLWRASQGPGRDRQEIGERCPGQGSSRRTRCLSSAAADQVSAGRCAVTRIRSPSRQPARQSKSLPGRRERGHRQVRLKKEWGGTPCKGVARSTAASAAHLARRDTDISDPLAGSTWSFYSRT